VVAEEQQAPAEEEGDGGGIEKDENGCIWSGLPMMRYLMMGGMGIFWGAVSIMSWIS
jgi:hypothetical protein